MRKLTSKRARSLQLANEFRGLPPSYTRWDLCDHIETSRTLLKVSSDAIFLFRFLVRRTYDQDWTSGREPLVAWSRFEIMQLTGWSEDKLATVENQLCDQGLIAFRDRPDCKRIAYRLDDGSYGEHASGISLAPAGTRAIEIRDMSAAHQKAIRWLSEAYKLAFSIRSELLSLRHLTGAPQELSDRANDVLSALPARRSSTVDIQAFKLLIADAQAVLNSMLSFFGIQTQSDSNSSAQDTEVKDAPRAKRQSSSYTVPSQPLHRKIAEHKSSESNNNEEDHEIIGVLTASPDIFKAYLEQEQARGGSQWKEIIETAADRFARDISVSPSVIGKARRSFGLSKALSALFDVARMAEKGSAIRNPSGYLLKIAASRPRPSTYIPSCG